MRSIENRPALKDYMELLDVIDHQTILIKRQGAALKRLILEKLQLEELLRQNGR